MAVLTTLLPAVLKFILGEAKEAVDRHVSDKDVAEKIKAAIDQKSDDASVTLALQQIVANVEEIKSGHWLGKWRGALGWGLAASALYQLVLVHFITFIALLIDPAFPVDKLPKLEWQEIGKLLLGMLGIV